MPAYEYFCRRCDKSFTATMHIAEHETEVPPCPQCEKSDEVQKQMSSFTAVTSHKSASY